MFFLSRAWAWAWVGEEEGGGAGMVLVDEAGSVCGEAGSELTSGGRGSILAHL